MASNNMNLAPGFIAHENALRVNDHSWPGSELQNTLEELVIQPTLGRCCPDHAFKVDL